MQTLTIKATADNAIIEELKVAIEGVLGRYDDKKTVSVDTTIETLEPATSFQDVRALKGVLNSYYPMPLTDEAIEQGIHQGIADRAMLP